MKSRKDFYKEKQKRKDRNIVIGSIVLLIVAIVLFTCFKLNNNDNSKQEVSSSKVVKRKANKKDSVKVINHTDSKKNNKSTKNSSLKNRSNKITKYAKLPDDQWRNPSQSKSYPYISNMNGVQLVVSIPKQKVYVEDNTGKLYYTMYCSTGMLNKNDATPKGKFIIQDRGDSFYNQNLGEGANYWTSFTHDNIYLFHTVPTKQDGTYNIPEAEKLGRPASHGCIRLSVPDARWINQNIPNGTQVTIK